MASSVAALDQDLEAAKAEFVTVCRILAHEGLADAAFNISARLGRQRMLINPVISPTLVTRDNIRLQSITERPSIGEVHPAIYRARPDVGGIVHTHSPYATAFGTLQREFRPVHHYGTPFHGRRMRIYASPGQVATVERGVAVAETLGDARAVLMQGHGSTVVGKTLREAMLCMLYLEDAIRINLLAEQMGKPTYLEEEESERIIGEILKPRSQEKAWNHYCDRLRLAEGGRP